MQLHFEEGQVSRVVLAPALTPFSEEVMAFLQNLSEELRSRGRDYPDVMAFAFWCRRAALLKAKERYPDAERRLGRGTVFHIAPGNVPLLFAYSLAAGLLAGNKNIVRLSGRVFPQADLVTDTIGVLIQEKHPEMKDYICLLRYGHDDEITAILSAAADIRVIWGGDATIDRIRRIPLKAGADDICFADRCGICVISAEDYLQEESKDLLIQRFYNDSYVFDQNACTSPFVIIWTGNTAETASADFRRRLGEMAEKEYHPEPAQTVGKLAAFLEAAAVLPLQLKTSLRKPNFMAAEVLGLDGRLLQHRYHSGYFYEYKATELEEILPLCSTRCGTITYFGSIEDSLRKLVRENACEGGRRIVPIGSALDFSLDWDGYDLIRDMSAFATIFP